MFFPCPRLRLRIWSRDTSSIVSSHAGVFILHTQAESAYSRGIPPAFRDGVHIIYYKVYYTAILRHRVKPDFIRSRKLRTDGVDCRESAGTGSVVLKVVPVTTGTVFALSPWTNFCAPLFPIPANNIIGM